MTDTVKLRPHHLLCLQFFIGFGYSDEFSVNTTRVLTLLESPDAPQVILVNGADDICASCPRDNAGVCTDIDTIEALDAFTLATTKLKIGDRGTFTDFCNIAFDKAIKNGKYRMVCKRCVWFDTCYKNSEILSLEKAQGITK